MEIHCVCESVHILCYKANLNTSELKPWALISIHILLLFWCYEEGDCSPQGTQKGPCTHEDQQRARSNECEGPVNRGTLTDTI